MNINVSAPINSTGYGIASYNIIKGLSSLNNIISYFPIGQPSVETQEDHTFVSNILKQRYLCDINAPHLKIWHQFDLLEHVGRGPYFAFPFFELDTFSDIEINSLKTPDGIFTTSQWAADVVSKHVSTPVHVAPLGVDLSIFDKSKYSQPSDNKYVFINIGKWEVRKGHDILLELFTKAFPNNPDVELWILASETTNGYSAPAEIEQWKNMYQNDSRVKLFSGFAQHSEIAELISKANCGIFPSRAEGWNMELLECMAMNKPVITTNYSAHTEFCNKDNSYLVDISATEKAHDGKAFVGQGNWAKIDQSEKDILIDYMRYMVNNCINSNHAGVNTANHLSWTNTAQQILNCVKK
jgi:glycosyltransferase involved in cell wall biosynthesis